MPFPEAVGYIIGGVIGVIRAVLSHQNPWLRDERLRTCKYGCELYDHEYKTCGTPGVTELGDDGHLENRGCWCYLPLVAGYEKKACWKKLKGIHGGWKR